MPIFGKGKKEEQTERPVIERISSGRWDNPLASVIASPTDEVILIRDGKVIDTFTEEKLRTREGVTGTLSAIIGAGKDVTVLRVDLRPFKVEMSFGEHPPPVNAEPIPYAAPDSTGEHASMGIVLEVVVDDDNVSKMMWLSGTETLTQSEIQDHLTPQIFAAIQPIIAGSEINTLRTTEGVLSLETEMREKLRDEAEYYGLQVRDLSVIWGASERPRPQAADVPGEPQGATPARGVQPSARQETREPLFDKPFPPPLEKPATPSKPLMSQITRGPYALVVAAAILILAGLVITSTRDEPATQMTSAADTGSSSQEAAKSKSSETNSGSESSSEKAAAAPKGSTETTESDSKSADSQPESPGQQVQDSSDPDTPKNAASDDSKSGEVPAGNPVSAVDSESVSSDSKIAFASDRDGNYEVYVMDADGSNQTRLTSNSAYDSYPSWSPDGLKITFASDRDGNREIYVMNADGSDQTQLTSNGVGTHPSWSPDGSKIAFTSERDGNREVYVMDPDGADQTRLTTAGGTHPSWSLDGSKIAFMSERSFEIYVMDADSSNQTQLTSNGAYDETPSWSPDGSKIAFASDRDGSFEIYMMDADGSNQTRLTSNTAYDFDPSWSLDGSNIAFASERDGNFEIYVMDADGSNQVRLTSNSLDDRYPDWWGPTDVTLAAAQDSNAVTSGGVPTPTPAPAIDNPIPSDYWTNGPEIPKTTQQHATNYRRKLGNSWVEKGTERKREGAGLAQLDDGRIILVGGKHESKTASTSMVDIFDPISNQWQEAAPMKHARSEPSAVTLTDGRVFVLGSRASAEIAKNAEIYDPVSDSWSDAGTSAFLRFSPVLTVLPNNQVLVLGRIPPDTTPDINAVEIFDPSSVTFYRTADLAVSRPGRPTATLMDDSSVLVLGGGGDAAGRFIPSSGTFEVIGETNWNSHQTASLLEDGRILLTGHGIGKSENFTNFVIFDPKTSKATELYFKGNFDLFTEGNASATAFALDDGRVVITGKGRGAYGMAVTIDLSKEDGDESRYRSTPSGRYVGPKPSSILLDDGRIMLIAASGEPWFYTP
jgi:Tol biopolymer transport system component